MKCIHIGDLSTPVSKIRECSIEQGSIEHLPRRGRFFNLNKNYIKTYQVYLQS